MKRTNHKKENSKVTVQLHTRGFEIFIVQGKLVNPERQVADYLTAMFSDLANSGEIALTGTVEIKVLAKKP